MGFWTRLRASVGLHTQYRVVLCKQSLYKSTYKRLAFKKSHTYVIADEEKGLVWVIDELGGVVSFFTSEHPTGYMFADYFEPRKEVPRD